MSTRSHQKSPRGFTLRKCPLEFAHFEKKCPREVIVHEKSPSPYNCQGRNQYGKAGKATSIPQFSDTLTLSQSEGGGRLRPPFDFVSPKNFCDYAPEWHSKTMKLLNNTPLQLPSWYSPPAEFVVVSNFHWKKSSTERCDVYARGVNNLQPTL